MSKSIAHVLMIEPSWSAQIHLPFNLGILLTVAQAFPNARISFLGDPVQIDRLKASLPSQVASRVSWRAWAVGQDADALPGIVWKRWRALPRELVASADRILMCSVTPSMLNAIALCGARNKAAGFLHGNAADFAGWRSRNPIRRALDITSSALRFAAGGGKLIVLEQHIAASLSQQLPALAKALHHLPHPVLPQEADLVSEASDTGPIRIAFAGTTSNAKGFPQFVELADALRKSAPGRFEFNAIGFLHADARNTDQSSLAQRAATQQLDRADYIAAMRRQHFLFLWQNEAYYGNAASGVFYDALNFRLPLLARRTRLLSQYEADGFPTGILFDDLTQMVSALSTRSHEDLLASRQTTVETLVALRRRFEPDMLAEPLAAILKQGSAQ